MIIDGHRRFITAPFESESELEDVVLQHSELIFGPDSILLPKKLIQSAEGDGTIPNGFVIDLAERRWFVIEAELAAHGVWSHIAPQVAKQIIAAAQPKTRALLTELVVGRVKEDPELMDRFEEHGIAEIDIRHAITEILGTPPVVGLPIDAIGRDLREWAETLRSEVRLWQIRKLVNYERPAEVIYEIPDEYRPSLDTGEEGEEGRGYTVYDVSIADLLGTDRLSAGETLHMVYKPRSGEQRQDTATIEEDGSLTVLGERFGAPSYAALRVINDAGSPRKTVNGWLAWKNSNGRTLAELRDDYLAALSSESASDVG